MDSQSEKAEREESRLQFNKQLFKHISLLITGTGSVSAFFWKESSSESPAVF